MEKEKTKQFKKLLLDLKTQILSGSSFTSRDDLQISPEDLAEEGDLASNVIHQHLTFNIRQRELSKLRQIEEALERIENGYFGFCEECDQEIGEKRLLTQPWTSLCIEHAEEKEREQIGLIAVNE